MIKKFAIFFLFAFAVLPAWGQDRLLANRNLNGLYAKSLEQVLRLNQDEVDLGTATLIISEQWDEVVNGQRYLVRLDEMASEIQRRLDEKQIPVNYKAIPVINQYLYEEIGFKAVDKADNPDDLFLHSVLDKKKGYCLSLSILYLSIGERLGLPLYGVVVPGHFFVRYDDGKVRFNIEATSGGGSATDQHYIDKFKVPANDESRLYMINLNKLQTLGCFFNNLGNSYSAVGDTEAAQKALEKAVELDPSLTESRTNLGNIYLRKGMLEDAIDEYNAALKINPDDSKTHNNLGNAYVQKGWLNDAIVQYKLSMRFDPNFIDAYKNLAATYCKAKSFGEAMMTIEQAIAVNPQNIELCIQKGDIYYQSEDYEKALACYQKALKEKKTAELYCSIAQCYDKMGLEDQKVDAYQRALAIKADSVAALVNLGNNCFSKKDFAGAIEYYKRAAMIRPDDYTLHYNLGAAMSNSGQYESSEVEYLKALKIEPNSGETHNALAGAYYKMEKYDLAMEHIKRAKELGFEVNNDLFKAIQSNLK